jgi:hypothetical protein
VRCAPNLKEGAANGRECALPSAEIGVGSGKRHNQSQTPRQKAGRSMQLLVILRPEKATIS